MVYLYLFLAFAIFGLVGASLSHRLKPSVWGPVGVAGLSVVGCVLAINSLAGATQLGVFSHPVFGTIPFVCDSLSAWFVLIVGALFAIGAIYGRHYLAHYTASSRQNALHWLMFMVTLLGLFILMTTQNMIVFLLGWEMMAIGSFFAVIYEYDHPQVLKSGLNYFIQSHVAVLLITIVFAWAIAVSGKTTFDGLRYFFNHVSAGQQYTAMILLIIGFGFKAGIVPFHSWLPYAHPAAPSHISALMSGVIVKAGIYGIVRFGSMVVAPGVESPVGVTLLVMGIVSGLYGIVNAAEHRDFKRMLAYCTIENIGIICMGLGLGFIGLSMHSVPFIFLGFGGALLHTLNHAIFKSLLFFGAGNVYVTVHTRNMDDLGGLGRYMPRTCFIFLVGSLAIGGLPPFGGFLSELLIYSGLFKGFAFNSLPMSVLMVVACVSLAIIGGVSLLAFTKSFGVIFLGNPRKEYKHEPKEVGNGMLWPAYAIIAIIVCVLLFAGHMLSTAYALSAEVFNVPLAESDIAILNESVALITTVGRIMLILMLVIALFILVRHLFAGRRPVDYSGTWGCGYLKPIEGIQYTGKSFAKTLIDMCRVILPSSTRFTPLTEEEVFPTNRAHISTDSDLVDFKLLDPGTKALNHGLDLFQFIQNGNLQRYIVYGLGYILLLVASVILFG